MTAATCPSREMLLGYVVGTIPEPSADQIAEHLNHCACCEQTVRELETHGDTVMAALRQPARNEAPAAGPGFQRVLKRLHQMKPGAAEPAASHGSPAAAEKPHQAPTLGDYELLKKLGQGGMGAVYKARHKKLKRIVALKVLPKDRLRNAEAVARFEREMEAVGRLDHPHIVRATDAREIGGVHFLVMEYVEGFDLAQVVRRCGALSIADACEVIRQAAVGLQCSHENGLVHRDIKPSNLMLTTAGEVKVLDLGLAQIQQSEDIGDDVTGVGRIMGTPDYISPEQASDSHGVDIRTDIYSLGCSLYHLLAGHPPFTGPKYDSPMKRVTAHVYEEIPPIEFVRQDVPKPVAALISQMLAKDVQTRPQTPSAIVDALAVFCEGSKLIALVREAQRQRPSDSDEGDSHVDTGDLRASVEGETSRDPSQMPHQEEPQGEPLEFDPYHRWLGIPREEQPADHYRLLGIVAFESDAEVIRDAAARQMAHVRTYHLGQHAELSQRILNELAAAKTCLSNPKKKAAYDAKLRAELGPAVRTDGPASAEPEVAALVPPMSVPSAPIHLPRISPTDRPSAKRRVLSGLTLRKKPLILVAVSAAMVAILFGVVLKMQTPEGTLVVEIDDPEATVQVLGDEGKVLVQGKGDNGKLVFGVDPGKRRLRVEKDGMVLFSQDFTIAPRGKETIRARLETPIPQKATAPLDTAAPRPSPKEEKTRSDHVGETMHAAVPLSAPLPVGAFDVEKARQRQAACAEKLGLPVELRNKTGIRMVLIPPGTFVWPRSARVSRRDVREPFYLGACEVTQEQYQAVMGAHPSDFSAGAREENRPRGRIAADRVAGQDTRSFPVECVSWLDAAEFCNRLSQAEGLPPYYRIEKTTASPTGARSYCLPSAAGWIYAATGGISLELMDANVWDAYAWFANNSGDMPHPVGQKQPTGFGLFDMFGNVGEYTGLPGKMRGQNFRGFASDLNALIGYGWPCTAHGPIHGFRVAKILSADELMKAKSPADPPFDDHAPARKAVEAVLSLGARVTASLDGEEWPIDAPDDLPGERLRIDTVDFRRISVNDEGLKHLVALKSLRKLVCRRIHLTEVGLQTIAGLESLEELDLGDRTPITNQGLAHIASLKNLRFLACSAQSVTAADLRRLAAIDSLETLILRRSSLDDAFLPALGALKSLRVLELARTNLSEAALVQIGGLTNLAELHLGATQTNDAGLKHLGRLNNLRRLIIGRNSITDRGLEHLQSLTNLEELGCGLNRGITGSGVEKLSSLVKLRRLELNGRQMTDRALEHLQRLRNLTSISLNGTSVTDAGIQHLSVLTRLETLFLARTQVSDAAVPALTKLPNLRHINLLGTKVTAVGVVELKTALPRCRIRVSPAVQTEVDRLQPPSTEVEEEWDLDWLDDSESDM